MYFGDKHKTITSYYVQKQFAQTVLSGLTVEEKQMCIRIFDKICNNAEDYLRKHKEKTNENHILCKEKNLLLIAGIVWLIAGINVARLGVISYRNIIQQNKTKGRNLNDSKDLCLYVDHCNGAAVIVLKHALSQGLFQFIYFLRYSLGVIETYFRKTREKCPGEEKPR